MARWYFPNCRDSTVIRNLGTWHCRCQQAPQSRDFSIWDGDRALPCQTTVTSRWPDQVGALAFMLIFWPTLRLEGKACLGAGTIKPPREGSAAVVVVDGAVRLESGVATLHLSSPGDILELRTGLVADGASERLLGDCHHPFWEDDSGTVWKAVLDQDGWQVVSPGPIHAIVQGRGKHQSEDGRRCFDFQLRLHAYAGKPWFQAEYRLLHAEEEAELLVRRIAWRWQAARPLSSAGQRAVARSIIAPRPRNCLERWRWSRKRWTGCERDNEQMPETHYGTFW